MTTHGRAPLAPAGRAQDGAILIVVLLIITVLAIGAGAITTFSYSAVKDSSAQSGRSRVIYALDSGIQGEAENVRRQPGSTVSCPTTDLTITGADVPPPTANTTIDVTVHCQPSAPLTFDATAKECPISPPGSCTPDAQSIHAGVSFTTVATQRVASITTYTVNGGG